MRPRHFSPDHPYLRTSDLSLCPVDVCDALAEIELRALGVIHAFDLDEGGVGVGGSLSCTTIRISVCVSGYNS